VEDSAVLNQGLVLVLQAVQVVEKVLLEMAAGVLLHLDRVTLAELQVALLATSLGAVAVAQE
jgi:hypothetical protein